MKLQMDFGRFGGVMKRERKEAGLRDAVRLEESAFMILAF
jgi:hypothetical protein